MPNKRGEVLKLMFLSFITSLIGPCINVDPRSSLIFVSSYVSMIAQVIVMSSLQIVAYFFPYLLEDQFREIRNFSTFYWCLIAIVIITSLAPYLLLEERRQIISFQLGLGPICCDENYKFHWACEREYKALIHYHLKSSNNDEILNQNINGQNVLHYSLYNRKFESVKALILPPNDIFDDAQVRKIFCYSCYKGHDEVVKLVLRAYSQKQKFFWKKMMKEQVIFYITWKYLLRTQLLGTEFREVRYTSFFLLTIVNIASKLSYLSPTCEEIVNICHLQKG